MANNMNEFIKALDFNGMTLTENGALTNKSTGAVLTDQFGKAANYRGRSIDEVFADQKALWFADQKALWDEDADKALRFPFYLRMITRKTKVNDENTTDKVQKGQGARDEAFKRLLWIAAFHPESFYKNIWVLPLIGSWKDIWTLLFYDVEFKVNTLKKDVMFELIKQGLLCHTHVDLIKKFMPRIKSNGKCKTSWTRVTNQLAKDFANYNKMSYEDYNHLKTSGSAHDFQKAICAKRFDDLEWSKIPGRALNQLTNSKFLENHGLEKNYTEWVVKQPTAKFTGYVYELGHQVIKSIYGYRYGYGTINVPLYKKVTWNKQFDELIRKAQEDDKITGNVWCALDTSVSMTSPVVGDISAYDICISLGVFFSTLNKGAFNKNVIMFGNESHVKQLHGDFTDMITDIVHSDTAWGSTNFQSVVDEIVRIRKENPSIPLEDYPKTLLVVSDMQFNPSGSNETNYETAKAKLATVFPKEWVDEFKFIWWDCTSRKSDFPATLDDGGCYFMSGFDGSIISMLCGEEVEAKEMLEKKSITMEEVIDSALNQEILNYIKL